MAFLRKIFLFFLMRLVTDRWRKALLNLGYLNIFVNRIYLRELDLWIRKDEGLPVLLNYPLSIFLYQQPKAHFRIDKKKLLLKIRDLEFEVETAEEIFIAHEIFVRGIYHFLLAGKFNLIDVGMNVGMASLFFAKMDNIEHVYAFEPFQDTYNQALLNFSKNPDFFRKITPHNFGLGSANRKLTVEYSPEHRGRSGIYGTRYVLEKIERSYEVEITIKDTVMVFEKLPKFNEENWILKIDTEGSEFDIIRSLDSRNMLGKFHIIILEWHEKDPGDIISSLLKAGFKIISREASSKAGLIYAFR